jgi:hypothetical protein
MALVVHSKTALLLQIFYKYFQQEIASGSLYWF